MDREDILKNRCWRSRQLLLKWTALRPLNQSKVVEAILAMNNIALVPMGDKFIKVVQAGSTDLVGQGMEINLDPDLSSQLRRFCYHRNSTSKCKSKRFRQPYNTFYTPTGKS